MVFSYNFDYYEPGEDSYAFEDLLKELNIKNKVILDLGCSTCILTNTLKKENLVISTDINKLCFNYINNINYTDTKKQYNLIHADMFDCLDTNYIDIILFNSPYVLNDDLYEYSDKYLNEKYDTTILDGGKEGCDVIDVFIDKINGIKRDVTVYLLVIKANLLKNSIESKISREFSVKLVKTKKVIGETIMIYEIKK